MTDSVRQMPRPGSFMALATAVGIPLLLNDLVMTATDGHEGRSADGPITRWVRGFLLALFSFFVYQWIASALIARDPVWAMAASYVLGTIGLSCLLALYVFRERPSGMISIKGAQVIALTAVGVSICILPMTSAAVLFAVMPGSGTLLLQIVLAYLAICGLCSLAYPKLIRQLAVVNHCTGRNPI